MTHTGVLDMRVLTLTETRERDARDEELTGLFVHAGGSAELRSTTTADIFRSISFGGERFFESLYRFTLPAPHGRSLK